MKKLIVIIGLILFISCSKVETEKTIIIDSNLNAYGWSFSEEVCSSGLMNMMTDMGLMAYSMADFMSGMCSMMPFGGMCPDLGRMAANFFNKVLDDPQLTIDLLYCANTNDGMRQFMLKIMAENRWLLTKIAYIMSQNDNFYACEFTEKFTEMSINHEDVRNFFFYFVNNALYKALTYSNLCENQTSVNVSILMRDYGAEEMELDKPFSSIFMNMGSTSDDNDGNEMANERLFYSMFSKIETANNFFGALSNMPEEMQANFMNFFFMGVQTLPAINCTAREELYGCVSREAEVLNHESQGFYNLYAVNKAFYNNIGPLYDVNLPPDPNSENEANALFGNFMAMLITENGEMTPFANQFFSAIITAASPPHCNNEAKGMLMMFQMMMENSFLPFTIEQFQEMAAQLYNPNAPTPRNFLDGSGDKIFGSCPELPCSIESSQGCTTIEDCEELNLYWCDSYCSNENCNTCDFEHLSLCLDQTSCLNAGGNFCDSSCINEDCELPLVCNSSNLDLCNNMNSCISANGYWCVNNCSENECDSNSELGQEGDPCNYYHPCSEEFSCYRTYGEQFEYCVKPKSEGESCEHFYPCENNLVCEFNRESYIYQCKKLSQVGQVCEWNSDCERNLYCDYRDKICKIF